MLKLVSIILMFYLTQRDILTPSSDGKKILNLPGRTVQVLPCSFDADERAFYDALEQKTTLTFNKASHISL